MSEKIRDGDTPPDSVQQNGAQRQSVFSRRSCLRMGLAATGVGAFTSLSTEKVSARAQQSGTSFDRVVDAVDDLGMDPTGGRAIDSALSAAMESGTLIEFPPGRYLVTDTHTERGIDNFGIRGTGSTPSEVKFVFPDGNSGAPDPANYVMLWIEAGTGLLLENFQLHQTDDKRTGASLVLYADDELDLHDVVWQGFNPHADYAKGTCCYPSITSTDGVGRVSGVEITGGGVVGTYPDRRMGILMQSNHDGELIFSDLDIRELGSTALRATRCSGVVKIEDSHFENNDNGSIRFGGGDHPTKQSWAKRCTVVVDGDRVRHLDDGEAYENIDCCRLDSNGQGWTGALVEDCEFDYRSYPGDLNASRGVITRPGWGDHGGFTVRNCTIRVDADGVPPVNVVPPGDQADNPKGVNLENVHITGEQGSNYQDSVVYIAHSDGSVLENCCINFPNGNLTGVAVEGSNNCTVASSDIYVGGNATEFDNSTVETSDLSSDGACRLPNDSDDDTDDGSSDGSGETADDSSETSPSERVLGITGTGTPTRYTFTVDGDLAADPDHDDLESWDSISGSSADGWVTEPTQVDHYRFSGRLLDFVFKSGTADVRLDGDTVDAARLGLSDTLEIGGSGSESSTYEMTVSDIVAPDPKSEQSLDATPGDSVSGTVSDEDHTFLLEGDITSFDLSGPATVYLNGTQVDPDALGEDQSSQLPNQITIDDTGSGETTYELSVSGAMEPDAELGRVETNDAIADGTVTGSVDGDVHGYRFEGNLLSMSIDGRASISFE